MVEILLCGRNVRHNIEVVHNSPKIVHVFLQKSCGIGKPQQSTMQVNSRQSRTQFSGIEIVEVEQQEHPERFRAKQIDPYNEDDSNIVS